MIFQRAQNYLVLKERPDFYDAGLGVTMNRAGAGGGSAPAAGNGLLLVDGVSFLLLVGGGNLLLNS